MLPLAKIMLKLWFIIKYADDTHIYIAVSPDEYSSIDSLGQCIKQIVSGWAIFCFFQLNEDKTEVIAFWASKEGFDKAVLTQTVCTVKIKLET